MRRIDRKAQPKQEPRVDDWKPHDYRHRFRLFDTYEHRLKGSTETVLFKIWLCHAGTIEQRDWFHFTLRGLLPRPQDGAISLAGRDVNTLLTEACNLADAKASIDWKPFIWIHFKGKPEDESQRIELDFDFRFIDIAECDDGTKVFRNENDTHIHTWEERHTGEQQRSETMASVIPRTPENEQAIRWLHGEFARLGERVTEMVSPEKVEKLVTLITTNKLKLLGT